MFPDDSPQSHAGHQAIDPSQQKTQSEGTQNDNQERDFDIVGVELKIVKTCLQTANVFPARNTSSGCDESLGLSGLLLGDAVNPPQSHHKNIARNAHHFPIRKMLLQ